MTRLKKTPCLTLGVTILFAWSLASWEAVPVSGATAIAWEVDAEAGYVGGATTRGGGSNIGSVEEYRADLKCVLSPQITKNLLLRIGAEWQRFSFGVPDRAPLPTVLQKVSALVGSDYQLSDQWLLRADLQPGIHSDFKDVSWSDVDAPLRLGAAYLVKADLQWFLGVRIDARSQYPAVPALGVRWKFADEWTLNLLLPNPRLEYELSERLKAYLGVGLELGTFRLSDHFGDEHGRYALNHAILDYLEVRVGPGFSWKIRPNVTIEADAGSMVYRRFDFSGHDLVLGSDPAPYVQVACHVRF
jgi:opacity protein-like surface antigen